MNDDIKKLAADLVKSPHWRWIGGMKPNRQNNGRVGDSISRFPMCGWGDGDDDRIEPRDIPDLDDHLTAAGLLLVARAAWAPSCRVIWAWLSTCEGWIVTDGYGHRLGGGPTETEALARAILAAPTNKETP